jgi:hypothetical protein
VTVAELIQEYVDQGVDLLHMTGFEDCAIGICLRFNQEPIILYDQALVLAKLEAQGMDPEEAQEWFEVNQLGAWMGEATPAFLVRPAD